MCRIMKRPPPVKSIWPHDRRPAGKRTKVCTTLKSQKSSTSFILQLSCSFLNLPRELRDEIYRALLPSYTRLCFAAPNWNDNAAGRFFSIQCDMSPYCLTVLGLCQQMRAEANAVLYGTNHFEFSIGHGPGRLPFNTIRALPQSGISHIKAWTVSVCVYPWIDGRNLSLMREWMDEMCKLLMEGGNLQEIKIKVRPGCLAVLPWSELSKLGLILEPLECMNGLKSVIVKGLVTEACGAKLKRIVEVRKYKELDMERDVAESG
ncbi:hypothetical protein PILCRDRAFT_89164 [Piloderma croceum F 1598]|uniref:Uncharacterized protein n=1 Tax=Piloderma croceum (strain F 1598) TaxID=765440 RepID=A0A0C3B5D0_PILCF|nr:hypothetical protein PILCRDRAFT_89164 [Piloderma croceum F 1598]